MRIVASTIAVSDFSRDAFGGVGRSGVVWARRAAVTRVIRSVRRGGVARRCVRRRESVEERQEVKEAGRAVYIKVSLATYLRTLS